MAAMHRIQITVLPGQQTADMKHSAAQGWDQVPLHESFVTRAADGTIVIDLRLDHAAVEQMATAGT